MATRNAKSAATEAEQNMHAPHNGAEGEIEEDIDAVRERLDDLEEQLRLAGDRLLESAKSLSAAAGRQMQLHPLAAFGIAFFAGVTVARMMRH